MAVQKKLLHLIDHDNDEPVIGTGLFMPPEYRPAAEEVADTAAPAQSSVTSFTPQPIREQQRQRQLLLTKTASATLILALMMVGVGIGVFSSLESGYTVAAPIVAVNNTPTEQELLEYGPSDLLSDPIFFAETQAAFTKQGLSYVAIDISAQEVSYVAAGKEVLRVPIVATGETGSWWDAPSGLYTISDKKDRHYSPLTGVGHDAALLFQGNFFIHGTSTYADGRAVTDSSLTGSVRLTQADAQALFALVTEQTPVLLHKQAISQSAFSYVLSGPALTAKSYLVADVENGTVLTASEQATVRSIASLTKLMTAIVAAEQIDLDSTVRVAPEQSVITTVPRLSGYHTVPMYTLMRLLLVESSNEAAEVIAAQIGRDHFIELMNKKATALGLQQTTFADPSGLSAGNQSSVNDLMKLVEYIYEYRPFIFSMTAERLLENQYTNEPIGELNNFNSIEGVESFVGGKIGETEAAGLTNVSLHEVSVDGVTRTIVVIVLGSEDRVGDVEQLLQFVTTEFGS